MKAINLPIAAAVAAVFVLVVRPWYLRWGASEDEVRKPLPGDELVPASFVIRFCPGHV